MFRIKRLYTFMLERFLPLFAMTFCICLFIVLMQMVWRYLDDIIGKGVGPEILGELFGWMALTVVPTALPLAVLLASLMTFGNLGEKFELTALKASGISLFKIMKPLIWLMIAVSIGAFFFQDHVVPFAQTKMYTLLFSMKQKSPELEIPERAFYNQIPNVNLYVERKDMNSGELYGITIYDVSKGFDNSRIILADSGRMSFTADKTRLFLTLDGGEQFENLRDNSLGGSATRNMPFRRESFARKEIYIPFDANFNRLNDSTMRNQYVGKNVEELRRSADSLRQHVDSLGSVFGYELRDRGYMHIPYYKSVPNANGDGYTNVAQDIPKGVAPVNIDSLFTTPTPMMYHSYVNQALNRARQQRNEYEIKASIYVDQARLMRRHEIEMHRKFTLSIACLIFFFIGAPLGAIIKKGGIGTPLVISVLLFIVYYIIDNTGFKLARDGRWDITMGIWLSTAVLLPLGIFLTYKAVGDNAVFNIEAIGRFFKRLGGARTMHNLDIKELIMEEVEPKQALQLIQSTLDELEATRTRYQRKGVAGKIWMRIRNEHTCRPLNEHIDSMVRYLSNTRDVRIIMAINRLPVNASIRRLKYIRQQLLTLRDLVDGSASTIPSIPSIPE